VNQATAHLAGSQNINDELKREAAIATLSKQAKSALLLHRVREHKKKTMLAFFFLLSLICLVADIFIGSQGLTLSQVIGGILSPQTSDLATRIIADGAVYWWCISISWRTNANDT